VSVTPPSVPPSGPSLKQAFGLVAAASLLLCSTCFGAFGVGSVLTGTAGDLMLPFILLAGLIGLAGFMIGLGVVLGRMIRRGLGRRPPSVTEAPSAAPAVAATVAPSRPSYGQAALLFVAGTIVFLSTCFVVVDGGGRQQTLPVVSGLLLVAGMLVALGGFLVMVVRLLSAVRGRPAVSSAQDVGPTDPPEPQA
jgi:hypothetical protein